jgi:hypothetical protein
MTFLQQVRDGNAQSSQWSGLVWHEAARLAQMIMESAWFSLWLLAPLTRHGITQYWLVFLILVGSCGISYLVAMAVNQGRINRWISRAVFIIWVWIMVWLIQKIILYPATQFSFFQAISSPYSELIRLNDIPPNIWLILAGMVAALRGVLLARHHAGIFSVRNSFRVGILFVISYGFLGANPALPQVHLPATVFLISGLVSLCCTRLAEMNREKGGRLLDLRPRWFLIVIASVLMLMLLIAGLDGFIAWQFHPIREVVIFFLAAIMTIIAVPFLIISLGLAYLLLPILNFLLQALKPVFEGWNLEFTQLDQNIEPIRILNRVIDIKPALAFAILAGMLLVILILIGVNRRSRELIRPIRSYADTGASDQRNDHKDWFRRRLGQTWDYLTRRLRFSEARKLWASARIRWVYYRMMQLMESLGHGRPPSITPLEFLPELRTWIPDHEQELAEITQAYLLVRYGEVPEGEEVVRKIMAAWEKIQGYGKILLKEKADQKARSK